MDQPDLFSLIIEARDEAIDRVERNMDRQWREVAYETGVSLAQSRESFTSEDIFDALPPSVSTHEPRAMGAVMRALKSAGVVEATDRFVTSSSLVGHGRPSRVWRSLMYPQV
jgi:hypothetical protein